MGRGAATVTARACGAVVLIAFLDTNVVIRHLAGDPPEQAARATAALASAERLLLADLVVAECVYVLQSFYEVERPRIAELMRAAIALPSISVIDAPLLRRALEVYEHDRLDFAREDQAAASPGSPGKLRAESGLPIACSPTCSGRSGSRTPPKITVDNAVDIAVGSSAMNPETRSRGRGGAPVQPVRLNREAILSAAEEILRSEGLDAMTMRRVGTELGADPTAIYRHFRNKEELVIELADRAFGRVDLPDPELPWKDGMRQIARSVRRIYAVHADFATVLVRQADDTPNLERVTECTLRLLSEAGLPPAETGRMYSVVVTHIAGSGLFNAMVGGEPDAGEGRALTRRSYAALPVEEFPHSVAAAPHLFPEPEEADELALDLLIEAIDRLGQTHRAARPTTSDHDGDA